MHILSEKGPNSVKMLDTVVCSCLKIGVMLDKKYAKYKSNMSMDIGNILEVVRKHSNAHADAGLSRIARLYIFHI